MKIPILALVVAFVLHCAGRAATILLDMEGPPAQGGFLSQYLEDGFRILPKPPDTSFQSIGPQLGSGFPQNGGKYLQLLIGPPQSFVISKVDGGAFNAIRVDLAEYSTVFTTPATIGFRGFQPDNTFAEVFFVTDGIIDGSGPRADFQTFTFPSSFRNVVRIESLNRLYSMDNLVVEAAPIPEPGTLLVGMAVSIFIATRRRGQ